MFCFANKSRVARVESHRGRHVCIAVGERWRYTMRRSTVAGAVAKDAQLLVRFDEEGRPQSARVLKKPHVCKRWHAVAWSGKRVELRCSRCEAPRSRAITKKELRTMTGGLSFSQYLFGKKGERDIHTVWHDFRKRFLTPDDTFELQGYDLMIAIEKWAQKWPDDVRLVGVDDSHYCGSDLVLIEHKTAEKYHGTTVVYVPQCSGDPPARLFLYPGHRAQLMEALKAIDEAARPVRAIEKKNRVARHRRTAALFRDG